MKRFFFRCFSVASYYLAHPRLLKQVCNPGLWCVCDVGKIKNFSTYFRSTLDMEPANGVSKRSQRHSWKRFSRHWPFVKRIHRWTVDSPYKGPVMRRFIFVLFGVIQNKLFNKQSYHWRSETLWHSWDVSVIGSQHCKIRTRSDL